jgi:predicted Zn-dependent protease
VTDDGAAETANETEDTPAAEENPTTGTESLRLVRPPEDAPVRPIDFWRMRGIRGGALILLDDDGDPGGLVNPEGEPGTAERLLARGESAEARALADSWDKADEALQLVARSVVARAHVMDGKLEMARAVIGEDNEEPALALAVAALKLAEGEPADAAKKLDAALEHFPDGIAETYTDALIQVALGNLESAIMSLSRVCASEPEHAVARHQLGQLTMAAGDPARAGTLYEMAMEIAPGFVPPGLSLAEMLIESRQFMDAMNLLASLLERNPNALAPHLLRLRILLEVGQVEAAVSVSTTLKDAAPDHPEVVTLWAQALLLADRADEARAEVEGRAKGATGEDRSKLYRVLGRLELSRSPPQVAEGIAHLEEAIAHAGQPGELLLELAQVHLSTGEPTKAAAVLEDLAGRGGVDINILLSGALTARNHGLFELSKKLGNVARALVVGTPAEGQIDGFLASLP